MSPHIDINTVPNTYTPNIKPDSILVNYGTGSSRFADVQLADFDDVTRIDLIPREDSYRWTVLCSVIQYIKDNQKQRPFKIIEDYCLTEEDR